MKEELFNQYALHWAGGFMLIYVLTALLVSRHPRCQFLTPIQRSITVKILAICGFALAYVVVKTLVN